MLSEAVRILEEGKVHDAREIDLAALFGLGFPVEKGGLLWWAESLGPDRILSPFPLQRRTDGGDRPAPILPALAKNGGDFYRAGGELYSVSVQPSFPRSAWERTACNAPR